MRKCLFSGLALLVSIIALSGTALGAALDVDGGASPINAAPGNSKEAGLLISVTDPNGAAVRGLGLANFKVDATIVAPGGSLVDIKRVAEASRAPGFYIVDIAPTTHEGTQYVWKAGIYLFAVTVQRGTDRGQTVVPMEIEGASTAAEAAPTSEAPPSATAPPDRTLTFVPGTFVGGLVLAASPAAPTGLIKTGELPCQVRWNDNSDNEDGFNIYIGGSCVSCPTTTDWRKVASVGPNAEGYTWRGESCCDVAECSCIMVRAYNEFGESANSNVIMLSPLC